MARPSLADSLKASLSKGVHVDTAERIQRGLQPVADDTAPSPALAVVEPIHVVAQPSIQPAPTPSNQSDNQTIEQTNKQADKQTDTQASTRTSNQAIKQTGEQTEKQSIQQPSQQTGKQSDNQASSQAARQPIDQSQGQAVDQTIKQAIKPVPPQSGRQIWLPLNENQGRLLLFLYEKGGGLTNMEIVVAETGIAYGTARAGIDVLIREGYVTYKARHNGHSFRGFEYAMNNHLCSLYAARVRGEQTEQSSNQSLQRSDRQSNNQAMKRALGQSSNQTSAVVSSYLTDLKSTTNSDATVSEDLLRDPELGYWRDKGVNARQITLWSEEFQMPVDQVIQSLKYCRYEMVVLNLEEEKQISNPMNWFYKIMQRSGVYPKPANYKSLAEIRAEQMEQAARDLAEARERQVAAEHELAFQKIMENPAGEEYQALLQQVSDFAREIGGKALETAMKEAFKGN
jgi:hypothetical protein